MAGERDATAIEEAVVAADNGPVTQAAATTRADPAFVGEDRRRAPDQSDLARVAVVGASLVLLTAVVLPAVAAPR